MKNFYKYFSDIAKIYHESGHEKMISNYLVDFAKQNNLEYYQDKFFNVIIKRKHNNEKLKNKTIGLQAHMDMVCCSNNPKFNFKKDTIKLINEKGLIHGNNTSIGADDGVGLCLILSLLADNSIIVPNIEAIFTVQEETTMLGAEKLNYKKIIAKDVLNIDGSDEGIVEIACCGFKEILHTKKIKKYTNTDNAYRIVFDDLAGGHSGEDISKNRDNANKVIANLLTNFDNVKIASLNCGTAYNVIPSACVCEFSTSTQYSKILSAIECLKKELIKNNPDFKISIKKIAAKNSLSEGDSLNLISFIIETKSEVVKYDEDNFPIISQNLAVVNLNNKNLEIKISIRSSSSQLQKLLENEHKHLAKIYGYKLKLLAYSPYFSCDKNNALIKKLCHTYKKLYNKNLKISKTHSCCECGVISQKIKNVNVCIIAPSIFGIHSAKESFKLESVERVRNWLVQILKSL